MSIEAMNIVAKMPIEPSGRKFVALALANFADEEWACFPSVSKIAEWTSQAPKTVRDHLDALEKSGFICRERTRRGDGTMGVYRYFIQRRISPVADFASGEKGHQPVADFATHNHQDKPSIENNKTGARGNRLSSDWQPSQTDLDFALNTGWQIEHVRIEAAKFRDYWIAQPGQKGVKLDWPATWRNWVRNALPRGKPQQRRSEEHYREISERLSKEMANERSQIEGDYRTLDLLPASGGRS